MASDVYPGAASARGLGAQRDMQSELYQALQQSGVTGKLKANLRTIVLANLRRHTAAAATAAPPQESEDLEAPPLLQQAVDSLVLGHLRHSDYSFSAHVFAGESTVQHGELGMRDVLRVLRIGSLPGEWGALGGGLDLEDTADPVPISASTPLAHVVTTLAALVAATRQQAGRMVTRGIQVDSREAPSLDDRLRLVDDHYRRQLPAPGKTTYSMEELMRRYQEEVERRAAEEVRVEVERFKRMELAQMRMEEAARHQRDLQERIVGLKAREKELEHQMRMAALGLEQREHQLALKTQAHDAERTRLEERAAVLERGHLALQKKNAELLEMGRRLEQQVAALQLDLEQCQEQKSTLVAREIRRNEEEKQRQLQQEGEFRQRQDSLQEWLERRQRQQDEFHCKVVETQLGLERERDRLQVEYAQKEELLRVKLREEYEVELERERVKRDLELAHWRRDAEAAVRQRLEEAAEREEALRRAAAVAEAELDRERQAARQRAEEQERLQQEDRERHSVEQLRRRRQAEALRRLGGPATPPGVGGERPRRRPREVSSEDFDRSVVSRDGAVEDSVLRSCRALVENNRVLLATGADALAPFAAAAAAPAPRLRSGPTAHSPPLYHPRSASSNSPVYGADTPNSLLEEPFEASLLGSPEPPAPPRLTRGGGPRSPPPATMSAPRPGGRGARESRGPKPQTTARPAAPGSGESPPVTSGSSGRSSPPPATPPLTRKRPAAAAPPAAAGEVATSSASLSPPGPPRPDRSGSGSSSSSSATAGPLAPVPSRPRPTDLSPPSAPAAPALAPEPRPPTQPEPERPPPLAEAAAVAAEDSAAAALARWRRETEAAHAEQRRTLQAAEPPGRVAVAVAEAEAWRALEAAEGPARQKAQGAAAQREARAAEARAAEAAAEARRRRQREAREAVGGEEAAGRQDVEAEAARQWAAMVAAALAEWPALEARARAGLLARQDEVWRDIAAAEEADLDQFVRAMREARRERLERQSAALPEPVEEAVGGFGGAAEDRFGLADDDVLVRSDAESLAGDHYRPSSGSSDSGF